LFLYRSLCISRVAFNGDVANQHLRDPQEEVHRRRPRRGPVLLGHLQQHRRRRLEGGRARLLALHLGRDSLLFEHDRKRATDSPLGSSGGRHFVAQTGDSFLELGTQFGIRPPWEITETIWKVCRIPRGGFLLAMRCSAAADENTQKGTE